MTGGSLLSVSLSTYRISVLFFLFIFGAEKWEDPLESKSLHFFSVVSGWVIEFKSFEYLMQCSR